MTDDPIARADEECDALARKVFELRAELAKKRAERPPEPVEDYQLQRADGPVRLSVLFGDKPDLVVIHNMGKSCPMCTTWADGFNGLAAHIADRLAFVVSSPDAPDVQAELAESRGWRFPMLSTAGTDFAEKLGFSGEHDGETMLTPGLSVFRRDDDGGIVRVARDFFGPGDAYCSLWPIMELLPGGQGDWWPSLSYD